MIEIEQEEMSIKEMAMRITRLEGTQYAQSTLIKAMHDHCTILTEKCERQARMIRSLQGAGWQRGH